MTYFPHNLNKVAPIMEDFGNHSLILSKPSSVLLTGNESSSTRLHVALVKPLSGGIMDAIWFNFGNGKVKSLLRIAISFS